MNRRPDRSLSFDAYRASTYRRQSKPDGDGRWTMAHSSLVWVTSQAYPRHDYINAAR